MPSIYALKPRFQSLLRPLSDFLAGRGVTPNQVTVAALALSAAAGTCLALWPGQSWALLLIPLALLVRMALNAIDGMLAREHGLQSRLGAVLNELGDVLSDAFLYLPFAYVAWFGAPLVVAVVVLAVISEMTGVVGVQVGASRRFDGPMGKSDRAFLFGALALLLGLGVKGGAWVSWVLLLAALLLVATIVNRARRALREAEAA